MLGGAGLAAGLVVLPWALPYLRLAADQGLPDAVALLRRGAIGTWGVSGLGAYVVGDAHLKWLPVPPVLWPFVGLGVWVLLVGTRAHRLRLAILAAVGVLGAVLSTGPAGSPRLYDFVAAWLPGFRSIREPWRAAVLPFLSLALVAGHGAAAIAHRLPRAGTIAVLVVAGVAAAARWPGPLPLREVPVGARVPAVYQFLRRCGEGDPVLELPAYRLIENWREGPRQLHSTTHWLPLVNGRASYAPKEYERRLELARRLRDAAARAEMRDATGVRWIIIHCREARLRAAYAPWCTEPLPPASRRFDGGVILVDWGPAERAPRAWTPRWSAPADCRTTG